MTDIYIAKLREARIEQEHHPDAIPQAEVDRKIRRILHTTQDMDDFALIEWEEG